MKDLREMAKLMRKANKLTNLNCHDEARIEIANFFGYDEFKKKFEKILSEHTSDGYITPENYHLRSKLTLKMMDKIEKEYGKDVRQSIWMTL